MPSSLSTTRFPGQYATSARQLQRRDARVTVRQLGRSTFAAFSRVSGRMRGALDRPRVQVFQLHHVLDDELVPFRALLRALGQHHTFISYSQAVDRIERGKVDAPYAVLTFDDGQRSCMRAAKIMKELGISACFFVCPGIIGEKDYQKIRTFCLERLEIPPVPFMSWDDLQRLLEMGHEIGSHGLNHLDLAQLDPEEVIEEIEGSYGALKQHVGRVKHFAWPYGLFENFSPTAAAAVFDAGYVSCASAERGAHGPDIEGQLGPPCIRREPLEANWPASHSLYLAAYNSQRLSPDAAAWPDGWMGEPASAE